MLFLFHPLVRKRHSMNTTLSLSLSLLFLSVSIFVSPARLFFRLVFRIHSPGFRVFFTVWLGVDDTHVCPWIGGFDYAFRSFTDTPTELKLAPREGENFRTSRVCTSRRIEETILIRGNCSNSPSFFFTSVLYCTLSRGKFVQVLRKKSIENRFKFYNYYFSTIIRLSLLYFAVVASSFVASFIVQYRAIIFLLVHLSTKLQILSLSIPLLLLFLDASSSTTSRCCYTIFFSSAFCCLRIHVGFLSFTPNASLVFPVCQPGVPLSVHIRPNVSRAVFARAITFPNAIPFKYCRVW